MAFGERIRVVIDVAADKAVSSLRSFSTELKAADTATGKLKVAGAGAFQFVKGHAVEMATAAGTAIAAFAVKSIANFQNLALEVARFSDVTGVAAEDASRWVEVAGDLGLETKSVETAFMRMNKAIADGKLSEFESQIVRAKDGTVDASESFIRLATTIGAIKDPTERTQKAQQAFGRSWAEVSEMMSMDAAELRKALNSVSRAKIIDEAEIRQARELRDTLDELRGKAEDASLMVGSALVPILADLAAVATQASDVMGEDVPGGMNAAEVAFNSAARAADMMRFTMGLAGGDALGFAGVAEDVVAGMDAAGVSIDATDQASEAFAETLRTEGIPGLTDTAAALKRTKQAYDALFDSNPERDALELAQAFDDLRAKVVETNAVMANSASTDAEKEQALRDMRLATLDQRDAVVSYITEVLKIPKQAATNIVAELDRGSLDTAEMMLAILTRNRTMQIDIQTRGGSGVFQRIGKNGAPVVGATGGIVTRPTMALIGEAGPEAVVPLNRTPGSSPLPTGAAGVTNNITINMPAGSNGEDVVRAIRRYERVNGAGWRG